MNNNQALRILRKNTKRISAEAKRYSLQIQEMKWNIIMQDLLDLEEYRFDLTKKLPCEYKYKSYARQLIASRLCAPFEKALDDVAFWFVVLDKLR